MARQRRGRDIHGILLLDKPAGISSNRALQIVKRIFQAKKAGHTGSLDPFATGLLPICFGEATKVSAFMLDADKCYRATAKLGEKTTTADSEGEVCEQQPVPDLSDAEINAVFAGFHGPQTQIPPMYSALKMDGKKLYELARKGIEVERPARKLFIHKLELCGWNKPQLVFDVCSSKGTYIRVLAEDIAIALGSCAHLTDLRRTRAGDFNVEHALSIEQLELLLREDESETQLDNLLLPVDAALQDFSRLDLSPQQALEIHHGRPLDILDIKVSNISNTDLIRIYTVDKHGRSYLMGMAKIEDQKLKSVRLFPGLATPAQTGIQHKKTP
ncbi:MAG: tRNA pseudouridine(55) synthase TruB [Xanthomonadales bacterium]|nr:tRNA pseudouridine(55) synthase TruB [Xanthomonadales bacterium]